MRLRRRLNGCIIHDIFDVRDYVLLSYFAGVQGGYRYYELSIYALLIMHLYFFLHVVYSFANSYIIFDEDNVNIFHALS